MGSDRRHQPRRSADRRLLRDHRRGRDHAAVGLHQQRPAQRPHKSGSSGSIAPATSATSATPDRAMTGRRASARSRARSVTGAPGIGGPAIGSGNTTSYTQSTRTHGATLEGGIYPNGLDTKWWIEYGTTTSYGQQTPPTDIGSGTSPVAVTGYLSAPGREHHLSLPAGGRRTRIGTTSGYDYSFTTPASTPTDPTANVHRPCDRRPELSHAVRRLGVDRFRCLDHRLHLGFRRRQRPRTPVPAPPSRTRSPRPARTTSR